MGLGVKFPFINATDLLIEYDYSSTAIQSDFTEFKYRNVGSSFKMGIVLNK